MILRRIGRPPGFVAATAWFSPCKRYRYALTRVWAPAAPAVCWILLNPSTADENHLDPTLRRCLRFSQRWGFGRMVVLNLFAFRSPRPAVLRRAPDAIGLLNDEITRRQVRKAARVVAAWGVHGGIHGRDQDVLDWLQRTRTPVWCLGRTSGGHPRHPLYLPARTRLVRYSGYR